MSGNRSAAVRALIAAAVEVGKDNVSAVLVEGEKFAPSFGKAKPRQPQRPIVTDPPPTASGACARHYPKRHPAR